MLFYVFIFSFLFVFAPLLPHCILLPSLIIFHVVLPHPSSSQTEFLFLLLLLIIISHSSPNENEFCRENRPLTRHNLFYHPSPLCFISLTHTTYTPLFYFYLSLSLSLSDIKIIYPNRKRDGVVLHSLPVLPSFLPPVLSSGLSSVPF